MAFTLYYVDGDEEVFVDEAGKKDRNNFVFTGFGNGIHPYHKKEWDWVIKMLLSKGIVLNIKNVSTVDQIGENADSGEFEMEDLHLPKDAKISEDGKTYIVIQDTEMGRGWAVLLYVRHGSGNIIIQDHRDNVRDQLMNGEWIRSCRINYKRKQVKDLSKI